MSIPFLFHLSGSLSGFVALVFSMLAFIRRSPSYAKLLAILWTIEQGADIVFWTQYKRPDLQSIANNVVTVGELLVFSFAFYRIIFSKTVKVILLSVVFFLLVLFGLHIQRKGFEAGFSPEYEVYVNMILLIACFTYFKELFIYRHQEDLLKDFTFWFTVGTLFYNATMLLAFIGMGYMTVSHVDIKDLFFIIVGAILIISNGLYIKAFLCLRK
jgi:hypothetical protein